MPTTVKPVFVRYSKVTLESLPAVTPAWTTDYECSLTNSGVTSEGGDITSLNTLCPDGSFSESNPRTYSLTITGVQDVESDDSLMIFLWQHADEQAIATYYPVKDAAGDPVGKGWKGTVTLSLPDQIGNVESGNFATFQAVLPYQGKPELIDEAGVPVTP